MKSIFKLCFILVSLNCLSQNVTELDKKAGFKDLKLGAPISSLKDKVSIDEKEKSLYHINNISDYFVDGNKIDKILIVVNNDTDPKIEHFTIMIIDKRSSLLSIVKDSAANFDDREKGLEYDFYFDLLKTAFGNPTSVEKGLKIWTGKSVKLITSNSENIGLINFAMIHSKEFIEKVKTEKAKSAQKKF